MSSQKVVFSGIQPSGNLHIGNYLGATKHWVEGQEDGLNIFCIVDLHAITVPQDPKVLHEKTLEVAAIILAAGIDPKKSLLFIQSHNPDHTNLAWILNSLTSMGQLNHMTQYKEKASDKDFVSAGLFNYPVLMAADILLYNTTQVPVGEDQKQHVELTRDIAERFNSKYGETFVIPNPTIPKTGARIMSLTDPSKKMSKSDANANSSIYLLDKPEDIRKKILTSVTDSENKVKHSKEKPGISNLIEIYANLTNKTTEKVENEFESKSYKDFKDAVAQSLIGFLTPFQEKYRNLRENKDLENILKESADRARAISSETLSKVKEKIGFV